ncbi:MRG-domain-containing protein [Fistulina hepatica ATCC 64428]|uniref:Chromatin modification-related protein EAF3 n=1 Tax=Fistulina hepatica ATCC 64428 TaxID=1128425 RepID=A0A0D7AER6_9AGAR|nr:MRG-domain-containing protein [Fistulina hepatica ATCC 64428]
MSDAPVYTVKERVLCHHHGLIYEAKVLQVKNFEEPNKISGETGIHYFVHYKGWKQTWDEWVSPSRLLRFNEENLAKQKAVNSELMKPQPTKPTATMSSASAYRDKDTGRRKGKRTRDQYEEGHRKPEMKLNIPESLKVRLVDDWEAVTKNNQLVTVPKEPSVEQILAEFEEYVKKEQPSHLREPTVLISSITSGLQMYFDRALGSNLLYRFERPQYATVRKRYITGQQVIIGQEHEMSAVYGAEHLLRMIISLPQMVSQSSLDAESVAIVRNYVNEFLLWIERESSRIFQAEYQHASVQYQNVARS